MLFLVDSYETTSDLNGNPREIIRVVCTEKGRVTNILWFDVGYKTIPATTKVLESTYGVATTKHDKVVHVQNHKLAPTNFTKLRKKTTTNNA